MADDPFVSYDAAYVLGALSPEDRHAFEAHLRTCPECTRAVQELAGLPGLLARADIDEPELPPADLLPRLMTAVSRERRRRRLLTGSGWLAAAACAATVVLLIVFGSRQTTTAPTTTASPASPMVALAGTPMAAQVSLTGVAWGTKVELKCSYPENYTEDDTYMLVVIDKSGHLQRIGSWKVLPGHTSTMNASTDIAATDIGRVEVQAPDGSAVLELIR